MREILFRAKAINRKKGFEYRTKYKNGDWVYGLVSKMNREYPKGSLPMEMTNTDGVSGIEVDHNTLGQFIGLFDSTKWEELSKKQQKEFLSHLNKDRKPNTKEDWKGKRIFEGDIVAYNELHFDGKEYQEIGYFECDKDYVSFKIHGKQMTPFYCEVIGNIHDNPELLENSNEQGQNT